MLEQARGVAPTPAEREVLAASMRTVLECRLASLSPGLTPAERRRLRTRWRVAVSRMSRVNLGLELEARSRLAATCERWGERARASAVRLGLVALDALL